MQVVEDLVHASLLPEVIPPGSRQNMPGSKKFRGGDLGMVVDLRCFIGSRMSMADSRDCQAAMSGLVARDLSLTRCGMASANRTPNGIGYVLGSRVI